MERLQDAKFDRDLLMFKLRSRRVPRAGSVQAMRWAPTASPPMTPGAAPPDVSYDDVDPSDG